MGWSMRLGRRSEAGANWQGELFEGVGEVLLAEVGGAGACGRGEAGAGGKGGQGQGVGEVG